MKKATSLLLLLILAPVSLIAQTPASSPPQPIEMKQLGFLVGRWKGTGWVSFGPGQRRTFTVNESVESRMDGLVLVVEGVGKDEKGAIAHHAFAVINYNREAKAFRLRAIRIGGNSVDTDAQVGENSLVWGFPDPRAGQIRFTISLNEKGQWVEIGEASRDGKTWFRFLEMTLDRQ